MFAPRGYIEKRDFIRMAMNCPVSYQLLDSANQKIGTCVNLSGKGILFRCDDRYPLGTLLRLVVSPHLAISPAFNAIVKIVRVNSASSNEEFLLAAAIEEID